MITESNAHIITLQIRILYYKLLIFFVLAMFKNSIDNTNLLEKSFYTSLNSYIIMIACPQLTNHFLKLHIQPNHKTHYYHVFVLVLMCLHISFHF